MCVLFHGTVQYANTKRQSLINCSALICCPKMQHFLLSLHPTLDIKQWVYEEQRKKTSRYRPTGKTVMEQIRSQLAVITGKTGKVLGEANSAPNPALNSESLKLSKCTEVIREEHDQEEPPGGAHGGASRGNGFNSISRRISMPTHHPHVPRMGVHLAADASAVLPSLCTAEGSLSDDNGFVSLR